MLALLPFLVVGLFFRVLTGDFFNIFVIEDQY